MSEPIVDSSSMGVPIEDLRARIEAEMRPEMLAHVRETAEVARELAALHGIDPDRAELAALLHDIADRYSDRELLTLAEQYGIPLNLTEARVPKLVHGKVGAEILRSQWGITDEELLDAVRFHISGSATMGQLAKVVFVADKLAPHRDKFYGGLDPIRQIARVSLDEAILKLYAWRMNELVSHGQAIHEDLSAARNALIERSRSTWYHE
jgi:predicted HD superfamily hydrolase involved in NAD metabolism